MILGNQKKRPFAPPWVHIVILSSYQLPADISEVRHFGDALPYEACCEVARFVLLVSVAANAHGRFVIVHEVE